MALSTAVPDHAVQQSDVRRWACKLFSADGPAADRLLSVFANAGISTRYSCVPLDWYDTAHGWAEKNRLYLAKALDLLERAARDCLAEAGLDPEAVDAIVSVSTSGIATPSLDALLIQRLRLRDDVVRLPIFGYGCAGGVLGLGRAAEIAQGPPGRRVLFLVVELCGLTFRREDRSRANFIATVLFGEGAAAALVSGRDGDDREGVAVTGWGQVTLPNSLDVMGWTVEDDGFGVLFSQDIPRLLSEELGAAVERYLSRQGLTLADVDAYVCHGGGAKVIAATEEALGLAAGELADSRAVLRDYGNMSAATVMFILRRVMSGRMSGRQLMFAPGPGFTFGFATLETP